jgi:photosystem II stability/assembly factor-like uncharacterized protein
MRKTLLILLLSIPLGLTSCLQSTTADSFANITPTPTPKIIRDEAKIVNEKSKDVRITETFLPSKENLSKVFFIDENNGWITTNKSIDDRKFFSKSIYKTNNGGKTWQSVQPKLPKDANLKDIFFVNSSTGWVLLYNDAESWDNYKRKSWLYKTLDGGVSWELINSSEDDFRYHKIVFTDESNGWMIGSFFPQYVRGNGFVSKTEDGGKTWSDLTKSTAQDWFTDIYVENSNNVIVSTASEFLKSEDNGKTWVKFNASFEHEFSEHMIAGTDEFIGNIGKLSENRYRIAAGRRNDTEGSSSYLAIQQNDASWILSRFRGETFCLSDIHFFNENQIIAVGQFCSNFPIKGERYRNADSAVLYSSNSGKIFTTDYTNAKSANINSIAKISSNHIIAVGDNGLIVNIALKKSTD